MKPISLTVSLGLLGSLVLWAQNVGIGTATPASRLSVSGNLSVGTGYVGIPAPANGTIIEGSVGIGTTAPAPSAKVEISATDKGILIPRLTTAQRDAISTPAEGLLIYNVTCGQFQFYAGTCWRNVHTPFTCSGPLCTYVGWSYYRSITINNPNTTPLFNYQVMITLDTQSLIASSKMQADGDDIRFVDNTCNALSYWIESGLNTPNTVMWVKVPFIPASSSTTIYLLYGNPVATGASDPVATFDFWEGFDSGTLGQFAAYGGGGCTSYNITGGILNVTIGHIYLQTMLPFNLNDGYWLEARAAYGPISSGTNYSGNLEANSAQLGGCPNNPCGEAVIHYMREINTQNMYVWIGNGSTNSYNISYGYAGWASANNTFYIIGEKIMPNRVTLSRNYTNVWTSPAFAWAKNLRWIMLGYYEEVCANIQDTQYDWVRVRKAAPQDVIISSLGPEEQSC